jgi:hypothetical protein
MTEQIETGSKRGTPYDTGKVPNAPAAPVGACPTIRSRGGRRA